MRRCLGLVAVAAALLASADASAQQRPAAPHAWLYGSWTGGLYPPTETVGAQCLAQPSVIIARDLVMRTGLLDITYRQRAVETAAATPEGVEIRLTPLAAPGARLPPDIGFGCSSDPNLLRVERRGPDEIVFPDCTEFPFPLKRCVTQ